MVGAELFPDFKFWMIINGRLKNWLFLGNLEN
jgi:hypothetical protein